MFKNDFLEEVICKLGLEEGIGIFQEKMQGKDIPEKKNIKENNLEVSNIKIQHFSIWVLIGAYRFNKGIMEEETINKKYTVYTKEAP